MPDSELEGCEWIDEKWIEEDSWVLVQHYRRIRCDSKVFTLYLRWRGRDSWMFRIAEGDMLRDEFVVNPGNLSNLDMGWRFVTRDLFIPNGLFVKREEVERAHREAEAIFAKWLRRRGVK